MRFQPLPAADNPKKKARDRELVSEQARSQSSCEKVTRQKALKAIRAAGPNRETVMAHLGKK
ncbi:DUF3606 domain-containing protein [Sinorhizobium meliloti]|uniref:DUF3606 domain-containing protein n=1 Tax=Rhizobium meliloti TaxID=382 RepID=UPI000FD954B7|nr:DUF3606 domain-containing protein [Sinorhizobium meliloti]RVP11815.1 DUF3606 domain-containing protein [Sinorhizobium meliloti]